MAKLKWEPTFSGESECAHVGVDGWAYVEKGCIETSEDWWVFVEDFGPFRAPEQAKAVLQAMVDAAEKAMKEVK